MQSKKEKKEIFVWAPGNNGAPLDTFLGKRHNVDGRVFFEEEDHAIEYLAEILVEAYLESKKYARKK